MLGRLGVHPRDATELVTLPTMEEKPMRASGSPFREGTMESMEHPELLHDLTPELLHQVVNSSTSIHHYQAGVVHFRFPRLSGHDLTIHGERSREKSSGFNDLKKKRFGPKTGVVRHEDVGLVPCFVHM